MCVVAAAVLTGAALGSITAFTIRARQHRRRQRELQARLAQGLPVRLRPGESIDVPLQPGQNVVTALVTEQPPAG